MLVSFHGRSRLGLSVPFISVYCSYRFTISKWRIMYYCIDFYYLVIISDVGPLTGRWKRVHRSFRQGAHYNTYNIFSEYIQSNASQRAEGDLPVRAIEKFKARNGFITSPMTTDRDKVFHRCHNTINYKDRTTRRQTRSHVYRTSVSFGGMGQPRVKLLCWRQKREGQTASSAQVAR